MITQDISTLKIHKLTQDQYNKALENNELDEFAIYLTPTETKDYALKEDLKTKADLIQGKVPLNQLPEFDLSNYYTKNESDTILSNKADLIQGKVPLAQIPEELKNIVTSWNDLEDKPFYEKGTKILWDGLPTDTSIEVGFKIQLNSSDLDTTPYIEFAAPAEAGLPEGTMIKMYKVSEKISTLNDLYYDYMSNNDENNISTIQLTNDLIISEYDENENFIATHDSKMWVWNVENPGTVNVMGVSATFDDSGVYFIYCENLFQVCALYDEMVKQHGPMQWYRIGDPLEETLDDWTLSISSEEGSVEIIFAEGDSDLHSPPINFRSGSSVGSLYVINGVKDNEILNLTNTYGFNVLVPKAGLYILDFNTLSDEPVRFNYLKSPDYEIITLDKKYLPDNTNSYSGAYVTVNNEDNIASVDMAIINWQKAMMLMPYLNSYEELYKFFGYGKIQDKEFLLTISDSRGERDVITTRYNNIRIGMADTCDIFSDSITVSTIIDLYNIKTLDFSNGTMYTFRCYQSPTDPSLYIGIPEGGIAGYIQKDMGLPASSGAVYYYLTSNQSDWDETNSNSPCYIKNKLVYNEPVRSPSIYSPPSNSNPRFTDTSYPVGEFVQIDSYANWSEEELENLISDVAYVKSNRGGYEEKITQLEIYRSEDNNVVSFSRKGYSSSNKLIYIKNDTTKEYTIKWGSVIPIGTTKGLYLRYNSNQYISEIGYKTIPHQLPVEYIPTDEEATEGSQNLITSGAMYEALNNVKEQLVFDPAPTVNSDNLITSGAIYSALQNVSLSNADSVDGYHFRVSNEPPLEGEVDDYTITFII